MGLERASYAINFIRFIYVEIPLDSVHTGGLVHIRVPGLLRFRVVVRFIGVRTCVRANERYVHKCTRSLPLSPSLSRCK